MKTSTGLLCLIGCIMSITMSCSKKEYVCGHNIYYHPLSIAFKGYSASDLSKVAITIYDASSNQKIATDTFDFSTATFNGDTARVNTNADFIQVQIGKGYEINVLAHNKTHKISNIHEGNKFFSWVQKDECSMGASQSAQSPYLFDLDGQPTASIDYSYTIYLVK